MTDEINNDTNSAVAEPVSTPIVNESSQTGSTTQTSSVDTSSSTVGTPPVYVKSNEKRKGKKVWCSLVFITIVILVIAIVGGIIGVVGRDWLRTQDWYVCIRNGFKCPAGSTSNVANTNVSVSNNDQNFSSPQDVSSLYDKVSPAVVSVLISQTAASSNDTSGSVPADSAIASGFVIDSQNGLIVTNDHVVCNSGQYKIATKDNKIFTVKEIYQDSADDIALLKVDLAGQTLPSQLTFAKDSGQVKTGQFVIAVGDPLGEFPGSVSTGVISGLNRSLTASGDCNGATVSKDYYDIFQTDAAINPGNSGGPLLNSNGEVIGVNSATSPNANGISFSIPSNRVLRKVDEYKKYGKFQNPFMGVRYQMIDANVLANQTLPVTQGAIIVEVLAGSPAASGGLKANDIITKFAGNDVNFSLQTQISNQVVGDTVDIVVKRKDDSGKYVDVNLKVKLGEQAATAQ